jgi:RecB family exonuclease
LSFGNTIHSVLEFFYKAGPIPLDLSSLLQELENRWLSEGYESSELEQEYKEKGRSILTQFYNDNIETFTLPLAVEKRFALDIEGVTVSGIIDRVDKHTNGDLEIIDYKTNGKLPPKTKIATDLQLPIYHMAAQEIFGIAPKKVTLYFLVPNQKMSAQKTKADIEKTRRTILTVADCIGKQKFQPYKNPLCAWCDFIELCPIHKNDPVMLAKAAANGKISGTSSGAANEAISLLNNSKNSSKNNNSNRTPVVPRNNNRSNNSTGYSDSNGDSSIGHAVDEYFELINSLREQRKRIMQLQADIHGYCETNNLESICGSKGEIKRGARRTTHYNYEKLRSLLEPRGLWEKIIDVNSVSLKNLLENGGMDQLTGAEIAQLVESAVESQDISYYLSISEESH